jgi:hypothetical protein
MPLLFLLLLLLPGGIAAAAERTDVKAGPGAHLGVHIDNRLDIDTLSRNQARSFQQQVGAVIDHLRSLPAVNDPPPPLCMDLRSLLRMRLSANKVAHASIELELLTSGKSDWDCSRNTRRGMTVWLNFDGDLWTNRVLTIPGSYDHSYAMLPIRKVTGRVVLLGERDLLILRDGIFPWRPFDRRRYLDAALPKAEKKLADEEERLRLARGAEGKAGRTSNFSSQNRYLQELKDNVARLRKESARPTAAGWICVDRAGLPIGRDDCADDGKPMEPNPAYWDQSRPERVQMIHARMDAERPKPEAQEKWEARTAVWDAIDWQALTRIVMP